MRESHRILGIRVGFRVDRDKAQPPADGRPRRADAERMAARIQPRAGRRRGQADPQAGHAAGRQEHNAERR